MEERQQKAASAQRREFEELEERCIVVYVPFYLYQASIP